MKRRAILLALAAVILGAGIGLTIASMSIDRWVMSGGEGARSGGPLVVNASIGQPAIGLSSAGPLSLSWGYWGGGTTAQKQRYLPFVLR